MLNENEKHSLQRQKDARDAGDWVQVPEEFRNAGVGETQSKGRVETSLLTVSVIAVSVAFFSPFFTQPFKNSSFQLRATSLNSARPSSGFVSYMENFEDFQENRLKNLFGWGGLDVVSQASQGMALDLSACRVRLRNEAAQQFFRFDVKVDVVRPGFVVHGLLDGAESEPDVATCLRDKINSLVIKEFRQLRAAAPKSYKLRLAVRLSHGSDGSTPF
jgi:hypothetical protein